MPTSLSIETWLPGTAWLLRTSQLKSEVSLSVSLMHNTQIFKRLYLKQDLIERCDFHSTETLLPVHVCSLYVFRLWHDKGYLRDWLLSQRRQRAAAGPLDVPRVFERWSVHNKFWCLVWTACPLWHFSSHTHTNARLLSMCLWIDLLFHVHYQSNFWTLIVWNVITI